MTQPAGAHLQLKWECLTNHYEGDHFLAELTITNLSDVALSGQDWAMYFNTCRKIRPETVQGGVVMEHVNGDVSRFIPAADFAGLAAGASMVVRYQGIFWVINETDAPLGFYIVYGNAVADAIGDPEIVPFSRPEQCNRSLNDAVPLMTPALRFAENQALTLLPGDALGKITPTPLEARWDAGQYLINNTTLIVHGEALAKEADFLRAALRDVSGVELQRASRGAGITLQIAKVDVAQSGAPLEAYRLEISAAGIVISGASAAGVMNGIQSLRQLLPVESYLNPQASLAVPFGYVIDAPRFAYRGMQLDVGRNFSSKETVLRLLDCMALYKLNKFHFHLTDDEGWRLEIPSLPELTEIGSLRGFSPNEESSLLPSFGSGAVVQGSAGTGFYTRAEFIEILQFATARHIEVIPEIDVPGHARAAIKAMELRYERLKAAGDLAGAEEYLLSDFNDQSKYESVQLWQDNVICVGQESCYRFIETVLVDMKAMFTEAGAPLTTMHTGGDEVPHGVWEGSPICKAFMQAQGLTSIQALQNYFLARYRTLLQQHNLVFGGWEEIALSKQDGKHGPNPEFVDAKFQPYVWNNVWGWGQEDFAYQLANAGYQVVLSNVTNLYFDLSYAKDPQEPGYYWGGFIETRGAYEFCPLDIYTTATVNLFGNPLDADSLAKMQRLTPEGTKNILGMQGQLWGENARSQERVEYLAMPRVIALAERAWAADPGWTKISDVAARAAKMDADWNQFANRLGQRDMPRLDGFLGGYGYRIPLPGVQRVDGKVALNISAPGLALRYTVDGSEPNAESALYIEPFAADGAVKVASFSRTGRKSRTVVA
jgi:hexosaminidase